MIYDRILDTIGNTPIVRLHSVAGGDLDLARHQFFAKLESFNPGGSVKDRLALALIEDAERSGSLKPGGTLIEATSGNTGMGLAMVAAVKGYHSVFVMPDKISEEKRAILRAYGARVVITPTGVEADDPRSHYAVAKRIHELTPNSVLTNQYHNPANARLHHLTTGPEIWRQMEQKVDVVVAGMGTGGTLSGVGRYLKEQNPRVRVVCADPVGSILHDLFYYKEVKTPPRPYKVEGVGEDMLPDNVHFDVIDDVVQFDDAQAFALTRQLTAKEGICVGPSSGGALASAVKYARTLKEPARVLIIMPDNGRAYLSKAFNRGWLRENHLLPDPLREQSAAAAIAACAQVPAELGPLSVSSSLGDVIELGRKQGCDHFLVSEKDKPSTILGTVSVREMTRTISRGELTRKDSVLYALEGNIPEFNASAPLAELESIFETHPFVGIEGSQRFVSRWRFLQWLSEQNDL